MGPDPNVVVEIRSGRRTDQARGRLGATGRFNQSRRCAGLRPLLNDLRAAFWHMLLARRAALASVQRISIDHVACLTMTLSLNEVKRARAHSRFVGKVRQKRHFMVCDMVGGP
jgi:hypothetical protein